MFNQGFPSHWSTLKKLIWLYKSVLSDASWAWKTVTGSLIHITDALAGDVGALSVAINPVQSGSGDPSPDNERPISGHSAVNVWDDPAYGGLINFNQIIQNGNFATDTVWGNESNVSHSIAEGVVTISCTTSGNTGIKQSNVPFIEGHKYIILAEIRHSGAINGLIGSYQSIGVRSAYSYSGSGEWEQVGTITTAQTTISSTFYVTGNGSTGYTDLQARNVMMCDLTAMFGAGNEPSTVADFEALFPKDYYAYNTGEQTVVSAVNGDTYRHVTVTIPTPPGTVYGGTLDVVSGVLTINKVMDVFNGATTGKPKITRVETGKTAEGTVYIAFIHRTLDVSVPAKASTSSNNPWFICSQYKYANKGTTALNYGEANSNGSYFRLVLTDQTLDTTAKFNAYLAQNPIELCYEIETPIVYQLTPATLALLQGENNVWADTGDTTMTYMAEDA